MGLGLGLVDVRKILLNIYYIFRYIEYEVYNMKYIVCCI